MSSHFASCAKQYNTPRIACKYEANFMNKAAYLQVFRDVVVLSQIKFISEGKMPEFYDYLEDTTEAEEELALVEAVLEDWTAKGIVDDVYFNEEGA